MRHSFQSTKPGQQKLIESTRQTNIVFNSSGPAYESVCVSIHGVAHTSI